MNIDDKSIYGQSLRNFFKDNFSKEVTVIRDDENNEELCIIIGSKTDVYNGIKKDIKYHKNLAENKTKEYEEFLVKIDSIRQKRGY